MPQWRKTVVLKDLLDDDSSDASARKAATGMALRLKRLPEYQEDYELESIVDEFEDIADPENDAATLDGTLCELFNDVLARLYDWADSERIWIGGERR